MVPILYTNVIFSESKSEESKREEEEKKSCGMFVQIQGYTILVSQEVQELWKMLSRMAQQSAVLTFLKKLWPDENIDDDKKDDENNMIDKER